MIRSIAGTMFLLLSSAIAIGQHNVRISIQSLPAYHLSESNIYLAGSFNGWNPSDDNFKFRKDNKGNYYLDLLLNDGNYEYKLTRGGWDKCECKKAGAMMDNRMMKVPPDTALSLVVEEWSDRFPPKPKVHTASRNVHIIDTAFRIPQLKRTRRIWIYLPENYSTNQAARYPVLYMQDGQNVFDDAASYGGEWGIDEFLDSCTLKKCIVVGIDHGGDKRINEYNPYDNDHFGKGEGSRYIDFLVKTLKPFVDRKYRTLKDKKNTLVAGSSMGGLISMYAVLKYPGIFGAAGIFSPSFWITNSRIYADMEKKGAMVNSRIYLYAGKYESESMAPGVLRAFKTMNKISRSKMIAVIRDEGLHNETSWKHEFPLFYEWFVSN